MNTLSALIVEDEPLAREGLRDLLAPYPEIVICGEIGRLSEAQKFLEHTSPDIVFLDIQLFGKNGFDLIPFLSPKTRVIFITAFDNFALRAFEINALDYLLKPVDPKRLQKTMKRILEESSKEPREIPDLKLKKEDSIMLSVGERQRLFPITAIWALTADGEYSEIHPVGCSSGLIRKSLKRWEEDLPPEMFVRIHRNTIINLDFIEQVKKLPDGRFMVFMHHASVPFETSRRQSEEFERRLQKKEQHETEKIVQKEQRAFVE